MEEIEGQELENESGASDEASPEPASSEGQGGAEAKAAATETKTEDTTPFHEHPRFKELVEQKNQEIAARKSLEERYARLESQIQKSASPKSDKDELIEHLRTIDPKFAERIEQFTKTLPAIEAMQQKLQAYEQEQLRTQAVSQVNTLHEQNKVSPELKSFINSQLDLLYMQGQIKNASDIPAAYKTVHETYSKFVDGIKRAERESYVSAKKADTKAPTSQPKGKPASQSQKPTFSTDKEIARQQVVSRYLKTAKAEADL